MLSILLIIIWFVNGIVGIALFFKQFELLEKLKEKNISVTRWSGYLAGRDLKRVVRTTGNENIKALAIKILKLRRKTIWIFWGTIILIAILFILNAIFNWQL